MSAKKKKFNTDRRDYETDLKAPPERCLPSRAERNNSSGPGRTLKIDGWVVDN